MAKTYTTVPDKAVRDAFSEAMWDTMIAQNINNFIVPPMCRIRNSVVQAIVTATETDANADTEDFDTDGMHDTVTNNPRIIPTTTGVYVVTASGSFTGNATGVRYAYINFNNGANTIGSITTAVANASVAGNMNSAYIGAVTAGTQYFTYRVFQSSGANLDWNFTTSLGMAAVWVGRTA